MNCAGRMRETNRNLQHCLLRLESNSASPVSAKELHQLRLALDLAAAQRANAFDPKAEPPAEWSEYRCLLHRLQQILPAIQKKLSAEKHRLEGERSRLRDAAKWAATNSKTL